MTVVHDRARAEAIEQATPDEQADLIEAAELVIRSANGSWKMLQRKMRLNQADAEAMLARLETCGVVAPEVAGQRRVLAEAGDLDETLARLASSAVQPSSPVLDDAGEDSEDDSSDPCSDPDESSVPDSSLDPAAQPTPGTSRPTVSLDKPSSSGVALEPRPSSAPVQPPPAEMDKADEDEDKPPPRQRVLLEAVQRRSAHVVHTLRKGEGRAVRTLRTTTRYGYVAGQGVWSWTKRATNASNHGHARQQLQMARLSGDPDAVERWLVIVDKLRNNRIKRLLRLPKALLSVGIASLVAVAAVLVLAAVVGILAAIVWGGAGWTWWWWFAGWAGFSLAALAVSLAALAITLAVPVTIAHAHKEGMKVADPPRWLLSIDERRGIGMEITPAKVAMALRDCGIPALRNYIKESADGGGELLGPISIAGRGMEVDVKPPGTVSTDQLQAKRRRIAEALDRYEHELYMTIVGARTMRFWIADPGVLDEPIGPSPLVIAGPKAIRADMKTGRCPWGENLRGDPVGVHLWQRHLTVAGLSNHGKTTAARTFALWLAYDVKVAFWIADLKGVGDWAMFGPINGEPGLASVYIAGPTDEHVIQATEMLEAAVEEMERRLQEGKDKDWDPLLVVVDEAQLAYMCPAVGADKRPYGGAKNTSRFFMAARKLHNQGRAVNVILHQYFQDPTDQNFPEIVREGAHIRISLVVGTESKSRMALGEAAVVGGAAPHLLRRDIDKGTVVMHGGVELPRGESSLTVRTHFIDDPEAWMLARGAIEKRRKAGRTPMVIDATPIVIDTLEDIRQAMRGEDRVRTIDVLGRLKEDNPAAYADWGERDLADAVREYNHLGLDRRKKGAGLMYLLLEEVEQALRERS